ncbi:MAG TPA: hypothetical protein PLT76_08035 [Candidatus Omnitrophota bacterium]|nr:hypothetical protein [Candidatus Omnitrophota bacterium]HQO58653.1 hypothetical protein [Candidatus Omnitrophota bacterium]HQP12275.1 hypothetical protein [Candidatus Omnitrophota bacterium]
MKTLFLFTLIVMLGIFFPLEAPAQSSPDININFVQEAPDDYGTDVRNIYRVDVVFSDPGSAMSDKFKILYYLDGVIAAEFNEQSLPFSFKRNFKGNKNGAHNIKIEVLDAVGNLVRQENFSIIVAR